MLYLYYVKKKKWEMEFSSLMYWLHLQVLTFLWDVALIVITPSWSNCSHHHWHKTADRFNVLWWSRPGSFHSLHITGLSKSRANCHLMEILFSIYHRLLMAGSTILTCLLYPKLFSLQRRINECVEHCVLLRLRSIKHVLSFNE